MKATGLNVFGEVSCPPFRDLHARVTLRHNEKLQTHLRTTIKPSCLFSTISSVTELDICTLTHIFVI